MSDAALVVTITVCAWCDSPRPIRVDGLEQVPPGLHEARIQISHGICTTCEVRYVRDMQRGSVTQHDTRRTDNAVEEEE